MVAGQTKVRHIAYYAQAPTLGACFFVCKENALFCQVGGLLCRRLAFGLPGYKKNRGKAHSVRGGSSQGISVVSNDNDISRLSATRNPLLQSLP